MSSKKWIDVIKQQFTLVSFTYKGKDGYVDPAFVPPDHHNFILFYDGDDVEVHSVDEVFTAPFFDGKCLNDIADKIENVEW